MADEKKYWFPAKRYGWGWGLPTTWQGWLVILAFVMLMGAGGAYFRPQHANGYFLVYAGVLCVLLTLVCWLKGEPPRWRRGD
ncbi:hypothetical protein ISN76_01020 [Dyella halodurans]|uniref:DUF4175 domain-containing protein n=1 Tax=Dyella halodurans TaxID=1920171 RepID=A0ABV9BZA5_9GAMM|nr:hypothetical protein [Dyella halodurans]